MRFIILLQILIFGIIPAHAEILIQNEQTYFANDGTLHLVGEIKNNLQVPLNQVKVFAILYDQQGNAIEEKKTESLLYTVMPDTKAPFDIIIDGDVEEITDYSLDVEYKISRVKEQAIEITDSKITKDNLDNILITGSIANRGKTTANTIAVVATLYDKEGNVVTVSRIQTEPDYLRAEDRAHFIVPIFDKSHTDKIVDYHLVAESEEYVAVPEFPLGTIILLSGSVIFYIGITKYSGRFIADLVSASRLK